jgi:hypothetical protein
MLHLDNSVAVYYSRQPLNRTATSVKSQQQIHGWFCNKASSVVLCANKFKSLRITQETEFGVGGKGLPVLSSDQTAVGKQGGVRGGC